MGKNGIESGNLEKAETCFIRIEDGGERLLRLINGLLDLARLGSGKVNFNFVKNDMLACIHYVCNEMTATLEKKGVKVEVIQRNPVHILKFDKEHIIRVLVNILSNALKFSPEGAAITITLDYGRYTLNGKSTKGLKVAVEDSGPGIAEGETEFIFTKYMQGSKTSTNHSGGSGVGLAICKEIILAHGGKIWSENRSEGGDMVSFIIPD